MSCPVVPVPDFRYLDMTDAILADIRKAADYPQGRRRQRLKDCSSCLP